MLKKMALCLLVLFTLGIVIAGFAVATVQLGTLVDENGDPLEGFSNVYIEDGKAYPVYNEEEGKWYTVIIIGNDENGNPICRLGMPTGTGTGDYGDGDFKGPEFPMPMGCFAPDTLILMADGSSKKIKDIKIGDLVMGYDFENGRASDVRVEKTYTVIRDHYFVLNSGLKVTAEHPFYAEEFGWKDVSTKGAYRDINCIEVQNLNRNTELFGTRSGNANNLEEISLDSIRRVDERGVFYNIITNGTQNFFVSDDGMCFVATTVKTF